MNYSEFIFCKWTSLLHSKVVKFISSWVQRGLTLIYSNENESNIWSLLKSFLVLYQIECSWLESIAVVKCNDREKNNSRNESTKNVKSTARVTGRSTAINKTWTDIFHYIKFDLFLPWHELCDINCMVYRVWGSNIRWIYRMLVLRIICPNITGLVLINVLETKTIQ